MSSLMAKPDIPRLGGAEATSYLAIPPQAGVTFIPWLRWALVPDEEDEQ